MLCGGAGSVLVGGTLDGINFHILVLLSHDSWRKFVEEMASTEMIFQCEAEIIFKFSPTFTGSNPYWLPHSLAGSLF